MLWCTVRVSDKSQKNAEKVRLDRLLVERGIAESGAQARAMIMAGLVELPGRGQARPTAGMRVHEDDQVRVKERPRYVSRGGDKLANALDAFGLDPDGKTALDVGASTGGFTDCLLQRGASRVYAVDVGRGQLHNRLLLDDRVVSMERVNARKGFELPERVDLITADVSFISLRLVLPPAVDHLRGRRDHRPAETAVRGRSGEGRQGRRGTGPRHARRNDRPVRELGHRRTASCAQSHKLPATRRQGKPGILFFARQIPTYLSLESHLPYRRAAGSPQPPPVIADPGHCA